MIHRSAIVGSLCGAALMLLSPTARAAQPCTENCAAVSVSSSTAPQNTKTLVTVSFTQAPSNGDPKKGNDDVAAIAFTLGIPGTGGTPAPLLFAAEDCGDANGDGVPDAVQISDALANFKVVVENADCTNRPSCLCPGAAQTRDDYINIVVYGPKDLSAPVDIPRLPDGDLVTIQLKVAAGAALGDVPLHVFAQTDNGVQKPMFGALLSIGDQSATDQTCQGNCSDPGDTSKVSFTDGKITVTQGTGTCIGDCNGDGHVSTDELVLGVNIALGMSPMSLCQPIDQNSNGSATVDEVVNSVDNALKGCNH